MSGHLQGAGTVLRVWVWPRQIGGEREEDEEVAEPGDGADNTARDQTKVCINYVVIDEDLVPQFNWFQTNFFPSQL